ncbi:autotransporter outer membrane beta-barrel domain-containing protein [Paraburkholderia rhizosphaerae]|uniref:Outer membrane autotransporter protein n=1 Tax=Paraburkholderia rhizosphaerae TaxID=480658 RepID=A0A4R8L595_9BURK|nr:autotransporter domain-containing protein [Paraburkholderia rhizosphaerae]TDY37806.1 outer membrane autotransporter protein [Paraburkholderia rhizosphaerae]
MQGAGGRTRPLRDARRYPFHLPLGPAFVLEPQAQVIWQHVGFSEENDGLGLVDPGATSGVTGRLGVRAQRTIEGANGQVWQPYVRANLWRDWGARATTVYSGSDHVPLRQQFTRMDFAAGVTAKVAARLSLYGQLGYGFTITDSVSGSRKGVWGDVGARYASRRSPEFHWSSRGSFRYSHSRFHVSICLRQTRACANRAIR